jgi:hypothetical protein
MKNLSLLTYTHTNVADLHPAYFGRIKKHFSQLENVYVTCNEYVPYGNCIIYNDSEPHWLQMVKALNRIPTDYVIYCQEDYILFDDVLVEDVQTYLEVMDADIDIPFIRLIASGVGDRDVAYGDSLNYVDVNSEYYFSTQATIWRKSVLIEMFTRSKIDTLFNEPLNSPFLRDISTKGLFSSKIGKRVGGHFNSKVFPYIATALVKRKWNFSEYNYELELLFSEYNIMPFERGVC